MRRGKRIFRWLGTVSLAACGLLAAGLAWPSPRARVDLAWSSEQVQSAWISLQSESAGTDAAPAPGLMVAIDAPAWCWKAAERLGHCPSGADSRAFPATLRRRGRLADVQASPAGESRALRRRMPSRSLIASARAGSSATILIRLRRHTAGGAVEAERLLLARELVLPVRTLAGLSAPGATWAAAILGLAGAMLWVAATLPRTR
jgi:hypothetical protein